MSDAVFNRDELIDAIARKVVACRLEVPAVFCLEINKPLAFVTGQAGLVAAPLLAPFVGLQRWNSAAEIFSERENVELLIGRIEELATTGVGEDLPGQSPAAALADLPVKGTG